MPSTTTRGFRYPLDSDPVSDGAAAVRNLADDVNAKVGAVAAGSAIVPVNASTTGTADVTFPAGRFSSAPRMTASPVGTSVYQVYLSAITATQATLTVRRFDNASSTANVTINWIAVQQ